MQRRLPSSPGPDRSRRWPAVVGTIIGAFILGWMVHFAASQGAQIDLDWRRVAITTMLLSFVLLAGSYAAFATAWQQLADHAGLRGDWRTHAARWSLSLLGKYVPGKIWQGLGRLALYHEELRSHEAAVALAFEAMTHLGVASCAAGILLLAAGPRISLWVPLGALVIGVIVIGALATRPLHRFISTIMARVGLRLEWQRPPDALFVTVLGLEAIGYTLMAGGYLAIVQAVGFNAWAMAPALAGGLLFGGVLGLLAIVVPAGLGVRDGAIAWVLAGWVSAPAAVVLSLVARVWLIAGDALVIVVAALLHMNERRHRGSNT